MNLKDLIYSEYPNSNEAQVDEFISIATKLNLRFINWDGARFPLTEVSTAIGRSRRDAPKRYGEYRWDGYSEVLTGEELKQFKSAYYLQTGVTLTCPAHLLIADYRVVLAYLTYTRHHLDPQFTFKECDVEREYSKLVGGDRQVQIGSHRVDILTSGYKVVELKRRVIKPYDLDQLLTYMQNVGTNSGILVGVSLTKETLTSIHFLRRCGLDINYVEVSQIC